MVIVELTAEETTRRTIATIATTTPLGNHDLRFAGIEETEMMIEVEGALILMMTTRRIARAHEVILASVCQSLITIFKKLVINLIPAIGGKVTRIQREWKRIL